MKKYATLIALIALTGCASAPKTVKTVKMAKMAYTTSASPGSPDTDWSLDSVTHFFGGDAFQGSWRITGYVLRCKPSDTFNPGLVDFVDGCKVKITGYLEIIGDSFGEISLKGKAVRTCKGKVRSSRTLKLDGSFLRNGNVFDIKRDDGKTFKLRFTQLGLFDLTMHFSDYKVKLERRRIDF